MSIATESAAGRAWVEKYLHPPSVPRSTYAGTPDNNMSPITSLEFETVNNVPVSFVVEGTTYQATDIFFLQTTGAMVVAYVFVRTPLYNSNEWFQHPQYPAIVNDSYDFVNNWGSDVAMQRMAYKSCTYFLNATAFNDQGTVTIAQARPAFFVFQSPHIPPTDLPEHVTDSTSFEVVPTKPRTRVTGEFDYNAEILDMGDVSGPGFAGAFVPATPTQVQQSNPKAVTHMARDGAFVTQHWSQPTNRFWNNADLGSGSSNDLVQTWARFILADRSEHTVRLYTKMAATGLPPAAPTLSNCADTIWTDFTVAYVYFSGLTVNSLANAFGNAYITVKSMYCVEVQPHAKSSFVFFQNSPPVPDDRAIHIASAVTHQVPDGFPASANGLGTILGIAATYAPKVISWLHNAFKANTPSPAEKQAEFAAVSKVAKQAAAQVVSRTPQLRTSTKKRGRLVPPNRPKRNRASPEMQRRIQQLEASFSKIRVNNAMRTGRYSRSEMPLPQRQRRSTAVAALPTPMEPIVNKPRRFSTRLA